LYLLACALKKSGALGVRPDGIISTAMVLHEWQRAVIEAVFACKVTNRYGCEEVSLIASECEEHSGLHVCADNIYHEVQAGGTLLVTDLCNRAMPLVRYQVGDVVVPSARVCRCGRGLPLIERVEGRDADYVLTPAGHLISGISLTENFAVLVPGAAQVQIVQESVTRLRIRLVADDRFGPASRAKIADLVAATFGEGVRHEVELVGAIPQEPSGKYRFCISNVARERLREVSA
jgi:phenylacetate-CoA ligase